MDELSVGTVAIGLIGGLALFLYGMEKMTVSLKLLAGDGMKSLLQRMTSNRFKSVITGAAVTAIIQSSSVTTVLVVGFISAGLLSLSQSIGIIMGASIGTTITAQIIAFKITHYSLVMVAAGFFLSAVPKKESIRHWGSMIMGLGLVFFGMELMKEATSPLRSYEPFIGAMRNLDHPTVGVLFSALFTALVQSSSATTGIIIVLASQGFLTLEAAIALVLGANIGTCVTAMLASIGKPREAVRAALVHVLFNTAGVLIWIGLIDQLATIVLLLSPNVAGQAAGAMPRQVANAHTVFNVANTLIFIGFTPWIARFVEWVVPDRRLGEPSVDRRYLDDLLMVTPALALDLVRMELARLGSVVLEMVRGSIRPVLEGGREELEKLRAMDEQVDQLHGALVTYLGRLSVENLTEAQSHLLSKRLSAANYFENMGDVIETNLVDAGYGRLEQEVEISPTTRDLLRALHGRVEWTLKTTIEAVASQDTPAIQGVLEAKSDIKRLAQEVHDHLATRLAAPVPRRLSTFRLESEMVEALERIYYFARRIVQLAGEEPLAERQNEPTQEADSPALGAA